MDRKRISDCLYNEVCSNECSENCIRYLEMQYLLDNSGIPKSKQRSISLEAGRDYEAFLELDAIRNDIVNFVNNGESLYITSKETGNGKTSWAIKLMLRYFNEVWAGNGFKTRGIFVHVPSLLIQLKNFNNPLSEEYKNNLMTTDLVVWDDIASTEMSKYDYSQLLMLLDNRVFNEKANIYTGNIDTEQKLEKAVGNKLTSRIWKKSHIIIFTGKDRRNEENG